MVPGWVGSSIATRRRVDDSRRVAHPKLEGWSFLQTDCFAAFFKLCFGSPPRHHQRAPLLHFIFSNRSLKSLTHFCQMTLVFSSIHLEHPQMLVCGWCSQTIHFRIAFVDSFVKIGQFPITPHHTQHQMHGCTYAHPTTAAAQTPTTASKPHHLGSVTVNFQALPPLVGKGHFSFAIYGCSDGSVF